MAKSEKRRKTEAFIIQMLDKVDVSGTNSDLYKKVFAKMSDGDFVKLISKPLPIYDPNGGKVKIDHMRNIQIMRELGYEPEQHLWLTDPKTGVMSKTERKHLVLRLPVRRQTQDIDKKAKTAEHNRTIDPTTGQTVGSSKGSSFSFPQIYVMYTKGYTNTIQELINARGGNVKAGKIIDRAIRRDGRGKLNEDGTVNTNVSSSVSIGNIFRAMHIDNNIGKL